MCQVHSAPEPLRPRWGARPMACLSLALLAGMTFLSDSVSAAACQASDWRAWRQFNQHFVQATGRVVDARTPQLVSTSEGQAYAMFFALVANDPVAFDKLWRWTLQNLFAVPQDSQLPAWLWGLAADGQWRVLDANSASDADLWLAYALLEAGRVWNRPDYTGAAMKLLRQIELREVANLPGLGKMLLPGPVGFSKPDQQWTLNPSYLPIPLLRRFAQVSLSGPWTEIALNTGTMVAAVSPQGFVADWVGYQAKVGTTAGFIVDASKGDVGSYDAIRVYLWAGMMPKGDPLTAQMLRSLGGMQSATGEAGAPPETAYAVSGATSGKGGFGFSAALLPYLRASGQTKLFDAQGRRVRSMQTQSLLPAHMGSPLPAYYDHVLGLFGTGWADNRYRFQVDGQVKFLWENQCS